MTFHTWIWGNQCGTTKALNHNVMTQKKTEVAPSKPGVVEVGGDDPRTNQTRMTELGRKTGEDPSVKAPKLAELREEGNALKTPPRAVVPTHPPTTKAPEPVKKEEKK